MKFMINENIFNRAYRLLGTPAMEVLATKRVIVFGVGGVGSWCAESLVRTGIRHITLVDSDSVCETNINRQLMATTETVGQVKVEALKARLLTINPEADIQTKHCFYNAETASDFNLSAYDYVVDAIDSLQDKALLLLNATRSSARVFSSMGAALKLDPTRIQVAEFWQVKGCPLGAALRRKFKNSSSFPRANSSAYSAMNSSPIWAPPTNPSATKPKSTAAWHTSPPSLASLWPDSSLNIS